MPNPPPRLGSMRKSPKRRRSSCSAAAVIDEDVTPPKLCRDHTYCKKEPQTISSVTATTCTAPHHSVAEPNYECRYRRTVLRQRVQICRLRKKVAMLQKTLQQKLFNTFGPRKQLTSFVNRQAHLATCKNVEHVSRQETKNMLFLCTSVAQRLMHFVVVFWYFRRGAPFSCG